MKSITEFLNENECSPDEARILLFHLSSIRKQKLDDQIEQYHYICTKCKTNHRRVYIGCDYNKLEQSLAQKDARILELEQVITEMARAINVTNNDHWFMINLIDKYGSNKEQTLSDCLGRMTFRKPLYENILTKHRSIIEEVRGKK